MSRTKNLDENPLAQTPYQIVDDGSLHKYRTEIPNSIIRGIRGRNLSRDACWLYVYLKSVAGDRGECRQHTRTLAKGAKMSIGLVSKAKQELATEKLIVIVPGDQSRHICDKVRIVDIWEENMREFSGSLYEPVEQSEPIEKKGEKENRVHQVNSRVHHMNAARSPHETARSPHETEEDPFLRRSQKAKKEETPSSFSDNSLISPKDLISLFNEQTPLHIPRVRTISDSRKKKAQHYLRQFPDWAFWEETFAEYRHSAFLRGEKNGGEHANFRADFDWLLSKGKDGTENCVKVHDGKYRDPSSSHKPTHHPKLAY